MKVAKCIVIMVMLNVVISYKSYGQQIFPIYNPSAASDWQQFKAFNEGCRQIEQMTITPQVQAVATQFPGLSTADGSAQLYQATMQNYQNMAIQNQQQFQWAMNIVDNPTPENQRIAQMLGNTAEGELRSAQMQAQRLERDQKRAANWELYNETGKEYWQYTNRPVTPGREQDAYDNCNRVYQRWP